MAISSRAVRKKKRIRTLYEVLTDAVNYYVNHGWDSEKSLLEWCRKLRVAAQRETPDDTVARKHLTAIYSRLVIDGGALRDQPPDGPKKITVEKLKPEFRKELDRRIFASANLIKLNREQAIEKTIQRFQGWVTSIPPDGVSEIDRREVKSGFQKSVKDMDFISRRVAIDQGISWQATLSICWLFRVVRLLCAGIRTGGVRATNTDRTTKSATRKFISSAIRGRWSRG